VLSTPADSTSLTPRAPASTSSVTTVPTHKPHPTVPRPSATTDAGPPPEARF
jgi:hypothetical protein